MVVGDDLAMLELSRVEVSDMGRHAMVNRKVEHLVEVAIVQSAIPANREGRAAHHTGGSSGVERIDQPRHVLVVVPTLDEKLQEPADRHVGNRVESVEFDAVTGAEFLLELGFNGLLLRRQECSHRIVNKIQDKAAVRLSVAESIQETECVYRFLKDAVPALGISLARAVGRKRGDDFYLMTCQELCEIGLRRKQ